MYHSSLTVLSPSPGPVPITFNPATIRQDFPILSRRVHGKRLAYLDNAATSQKPNQVIDAIADYYRQHNANVHRGVHALGDESTQLFLESKQTVAHFFGAQPEELLLVRNTTEAINQVAYTWGEAHIGQDDLILTTEMEHHSNLVPWQELCRRKSARLKCIKVTAAGSLDLEDLEIYLQTQQTQGETKNANPLKLIALTHVSNTLGTRNPIEKIIPLIRRYQPQAKILIDGAQAAGHLPINFHHLDADFYVMSAHKMLGPMGIGGLLVKKELLNDLPPFLFGGGMIQDVSCERTTFAEDLQDRFTPGTPDVASVVGWAEACRYLEQIGWPAIQQHDQELLEMTHQGLFGTRGQGLLGTSTQASRAAVAQDLSGTSGQGQLRRTGQNVRTFPQITLVGPPLSERVGSLDFLYEGVHAHDVAQVLDSEGVAVRSGHHCTMPLHQKFGWQATTRVSFQIYNSIEDVEQLLIALKKVKEVFGK